MSSSAVHRFDDDCHTDGYAECTKMKNPGVKSAKLLIFVVKYANVGALNKKNKLISKFSELSILTTPPALRIGSSLESFFLVFLLQCYLL